MAKVEDCPGFETFGADVKAARKAKHLTRKVLAEIVEVEWRYLANAENRTISERNGGCVKTSSVFQRAARLSCFFALFSEKPRVLRVVSVLSSVILAKQKTRVWEAPNKQKSPLRQQAGNGDFAEVWPHFLCLLCCDFPGKDGNGMEEKRSPKESDYLPKRGNPLQETVCYKLGGTVYEVHTSCGGTEPLYDKMVRLTRSEAIAASADKEDEPQYNKDSNLFVGRSLQEE